jgi:hypothetical protein
MRTVTLHTRALAFEQAAIAGSAAVMGSVAFAKFIGLVIHDDWLAPLLLAMVFVFLAECLLANKLGSLNWSQVSGLLTINCLLILAVALGFTVQRMSIGDAGAHPWGHYMIAGAIFYLLAYRFARVLREFGIRLGPYEVMLIWFEKAIGGPVREAMIQRTHEEGRVEGCEEGKAAGKAEGLITGAKAGWQLARERAWDTGGDIGPPPRKAELSGIVPIVKVDDTATEVPTTDGETGEGACTDGSGPIPPPPPTAGQR